MAADEIFRLAIAVWKDRAEACDLERWQTACNEFLACDADSRREKMRGVILDMARMKTALRKLERNYQNIAEKNGEIPAVKDFIRDMQRKIREQSAIKNHR